MIQNEKRNTGGVLNNAGNQRLPHDIDIADEGTSKNNDKYVRERLQIALAASNMGVWELDLKKSELEYDAICGQLFGLPPDSTVITIDALIDHLTKTIADDSSSPVIDGLRSGNPYPFETSRELAIKTSDGDVRYIRNFGKPVTGADGKALRVIGMSTDITDSVKAGLELKAAKEAAENANMAKTQFLSNMSHEIRTPMNAIIGMSDILMHEKLTERQRDCLNDLRLSSYSLLCIINDILDFSKIESGSLEIVPIDYSLSDMLENLNSLFSFSAQAKSVTFETRIADGLPECVYGDESRLQQALTNILGNAFKFTKFGGVELRVSAADGMLRFDVADTGLGIKPEDIPLIFKDFNQLDTSSRRNSGGTGLGLSITNNLIRLMGGKISVESEYNKGSTFTVEVPLVLGDKKNVRSTIVGFDFISAPDAQILVIDDNEVNLNVADGLLKMCDINCDFALSGPEGIEKIKNKKYDIVLMDHMMPEMDGAEATKILRETYSMDELCIIAFTANAVRGVKEALLEAGMNDYLSKPIDNVALIGLLCKWLPKSKVSKKLPPDPFAEKEASEESALTGHFRKISSLDVDLGLKRVNNVEETYQKSIEILTRRLLDVVARLNSFIKSEDMKAFSVEIHGVKGSLDNIGATVLAKKAGHLEQKSKENDVEFCEENLPAFTAELCELQRELAEALSAEGEKGGFIGQGDVATLKDELAKTRALLESFESDDALELLQDLKLYDFGDDVNAILMRLSRMVEEFEFENAVAVIDDISKA